MTIQRRRRFFDKDYKREILGKIEAGEMDVHNVRDSDGKEIPALLIARWKSELRAEGFGPKTHIMSSVNKDTEQYLIALGRKELIIQQQQRQIEDLTQRLYGKGHNNVQREKTM